MPLAVPDMVIQPGVRARRVDGALRISDASPLTVRWVIESDHPRVAWHAEQAHPDLLALTAVWLTTGRAP